MSVTADVVASCSITANDLAFGDYDPVSSTPLDMATTIEVTCTNGADYTVSLQLARPALALLPERFPARIETARFDQSRLVLALSTKWGAPELRLGEPVDLGVKLEVAALVLRSLSAEERASAGYLDVSVPERTVLGTDSQVSG